VFRIQARIESFSKVSPPDKVSPFFCTALPALFTVSCKPRFWIMVDFGTHGMIGAFKREIQSADWLCKSINK
ncbi:hypothetical protein, partial [Escherichia coli]|uniref:hypothetical protein n=2 Tax=Escherichia coli TaxID=562 RepID=UPI003C306216